MKALDIMNASLSWQIYNYKKFGLISLNTSDTIKSHQSDTTREELTLVVHI
jgi:hypothetical protein